MSDNDKSFNKAGKVLLYWMISIGVVGFIAYFLPVSFLTGELVEDFSKISVGVDRWARGSIYPDQMRVVWIYLYISFPIATLISFVMLDFSVKQNKKIPVFRKNFFEIFIWIIVFTFFTFFILKIVFYCELIFLGVMYEKGPSFGSFSGQFYSATYLGALVYSGLAAFCASVILQANLFFYCHCILRLIKRREL